MNKPETKSEPNIENSPIGVDDYKIIKDMVAETKSYYNTLTSGITKALSERYDLQKEVLDAILQFSKEDLQKLNANDMKIFLSGYTNYSSLEALQEKSEEELREEMEFIKNASITVFYAKTQLDDILATNQEIIDECLKYGSSEKEREYKKDRLKRYKESLNIIDNEIERKKTERKIKTIEESINFSFITKHLDKVGDKEIERISECFFDIRQGSYHVEKYLRKIEKFGYSKKLYEYFFNLEEKFLDEKYHAFNNLFLFIYMRVVSGLDPYNQNDTLLVRSITSAMSSLVYHKFATTEEEKDFIHIMENVLDRFMPYRSIYEEKNTTYPKHPDRVAKEEAFDKERREKIIEQIRRIGLYDKIEKIESLSYEELNERYQTYAKELIARQNQEKEAEDAKATEATESLEDISELDSTEEYKTSLDLQDISELKEDEKHVESKEEGLEDQRKDGEEPTGETRESESEEGSECQSEADEDGRELCEGDPARSSEEEALRPEQNEEENREAGSDETNSGEAEYEGESPAQEEGSISEEGSGSSSVNTESNMDIDTEPARTIYKEYLEAVDQIKKMYTDGKMVKGHLMKVSKENTKFYLHKAYNNYAKRMLEAGYGVRYQEETL